jgi:heme-degrading monooxygenase HmoA
MPAGAASTFLRHELELHFTLHWDPRSPTHREVTMYARVAQYQVQADKYDQFIEALNSALPLMRKQEGFQALLVLRVEGSRPPDVRVMTLWDTQLSLRQSENNLYFYQAVSRALVLSQGFPVIREEEVVLHDFPRASSSAAQA